VKIAIRTAGELGRDLVMAPERWVSAIDGDEGTSLGELVEERRVRVEAAPGSLVLDTTHARDGWLDIPSAMRATELAKSAKSAKKAAFEGDLIVSRLRPYLRQVALIHPSVLSELKGRTLALSTEFYVLSPREPAESLAFLVPYLLSEPVQARLAAAQEGGHHPRVPRESLFALKVPVQLVEERVERSRQVLQALDALYDAFFRYHELAAQRSR
jgi:hypothetical protein